MGGAEGGGPYSWGAAADRTAGVWKTVPPLLEAGPWQSSQTRTGASEYPKLMILVDFFVQLLQKTLAQCLQWWRRLNSENEAEHLLHFGAESSDCQGGLKLMSGGNCITGGKGGCALNNHWGARIEVANITCRSTAPGMSHSTTKKYSHFTSSAVWEEGITLRGIWKGSHLTP